MTRHGGFVGERSQSTGVGLVFSGRREGQLRGVTRPGGRGAHSVQRLGPGVVYTASVCVTEDRGGTVVCLVKPEPRNSEAGRGSHDREWDAS